MSNAPTPHGFEAGHDGGMTSSTGPRYSFIPARAVFDDRLTLAEKVILAALGTYTAGEGWCYPSQKTLCERLSLSRSTLCAAIKHLSSPDLGYLQVRPRTTKGRGKIGNEYRVRMDLDERELPMSAQEDIGKKPMSSQPDNGAQVIETPPMSSGSDNGADVQPAGQPMSSQPDIAYIARTIPVERSQSSNSNELEELVLIGDDAPKPKRKAKPRAAYTADFEAIWKSWPASRRANSDKRKAFQRYQGGVQQFGADKIAAAAKRYLSLPNTRKDGFQYCCLVEVFMNGKLEAAVEALNEPHAPTAMREKRQAGMPSRGIYRNVYQG